MPGWGLLLPAYDAGYGQENKVGAGNSYCDEIKNKSFMGSFSVLYFKRDKYPYL